LRKKEAFLFSILLKIAARFSLLFSREAGNCFEGFYIGDKNK